MKNQLKAGVIFSYISTGITVLRQLIYLPIMIRILGQSEYGLYSVVSGVVSYLSLFSLGFSGAYLRFFSRFKYQDDKKKLASLNGMFIILFCVLAFIALVSGIILSFFPRKIFGSKLSDAELIKAKILMVILVFSMAIVLVSSIFEAIIRAYEQYIFQQAVYLMVVVVNPFLCLPLLLMGYRSVMLVLVGAVISIGRLVANVWFCVFKLKIPISFHNFEFKLLREISAFSFFLLLNMLIEQINGLFVNFSMTISSVFSPKINRIVAEERENYQKKFTKLMVKIGRIQWLLLGLLTTGFIIFGKYFIVHIYAGGGYEKSYITSLCLVIPALIQLIQNVGVEMQRALNKHQFCSIIYFVMAIINVAISIPLANKFGLVISDGIIMNVFYHKILKINIKLFWKEIMSTLKGFAVPAISGILIMKYIKFSSIMEYLVVGGVYVVVYSIFIWKMSCNEEERKMVLGLINKF